MIETLDVIHCDVTTVQITRERYRHQVRCSLFFPARGGYEGALAKARRVGWTAAQDGDVLRHRCPAHSRDHDAGKPQLWWDLRARARTARENGT